MNPAPRTLDTFDDPSVTLGESRAARAVLADLGPGVAFTFSHGQYHVRTARGSVSRPDLFDVFAAARNLYPDIPLNKERAA